MKKVVKEVVKQVIKTQYDWPYGLPCWGIIHQPKRPDCLKK